MLYLACVALHVLSAIAGFGTIAAVPVLRRSIGDPRTAAAVEVALARRVLTPAMCGSLVTGLVQVAAGPHGFGDIWVDTTLLILLALFAIAGAGLGRGGRRALATLDAAGDGTAGHGTAGAAALRGLTRWWAASAALVVVAVFLMVLKPG